MNRRQNSASVKALRQRISSFFLRYEVPWELFMILLAIIFVFLGYLHEVITVTPGQADVISIIDWVITGFFVAEFSLRISIAPSRKAYLKGHWMDLVALLPATRFARLARFARILRLLRLVTLVRIFRHWDLLRIHVGAFLRHYYFSWFLLASVVLLLINAGLALWIEGKAPDTKIHSYFDALWWAVVTAATVGYGDIYPVTAWGRAIGITLMVIGIALWGMFVATLSNYFFIFLKPGEQKQDPAIEEVKGKLDRLDRLTERELIALRGAMDALLQDRLETRKKESTKAIASEQNPAIDR